MRIGWEVVGIVFAALLSLSAATSTVDALQKKPDRRTMADGRMRVQDMSPSSINHLLGMSAVNSKREHLAQVGGVLIVEDRIAYVILQVVEPQGSARLIPVPSSLAGFDPSTRTVLVDLDMRKLLEAPHYSKDARPDFSELEWEQKIFSYYGEKEPEKAKESYILISR